MRIDSHWCVCTLACKVNFCFEVKSGVEFVFKSLKSRTNWEHDRTMAIAIGHVTAAKDRFLTRFVKHVISSLRRRFKTENREDLVFTGSAMELTFDALQSSIDKLRENKNIFPEVGQS